MTTGMGVALGILGVCSVMDLRKKRIPLIPIVICLGAGVLWQVLWQGTTAGKLLLSCLPGGILLGTACLTEQKIGYGDGWVVLASGVWTGMWDMFLILTGGMLACAVFSGFLLAFRKVNRGDTLPFIPFLLLACIGRLMV